jgi:predicted RNase H-like HicB family nuclease
MRSGGLRGLQNRCFVERQWEGSTPSRSRHLLSRTLKARKAKPLKFRLLRLGGMLRSPKGVVEVSRVSFAFPPHISRTYEIMVRCSLTEDRMKLTIEIEHEEDGRWIAEVLELPGVMVYGQTQDDAVNRAQALALQTLADRLESGELKFDGSIAFELGGAA